MFEFGSVVFTHFPFTDLTGKKLRPALVVSGNNDARIDVVLAYITSRPYSGPDSVKVLPTAINGLKAPSIVRFDKLVTLKKQLVVGQLGQMEPEWLTQVSPVFFGVFGFDRRRP